MIEKSENFWEMEVQKCKRRETRDRGRVESPFYILLLSAQLHPLLMEYAHQLVLLSIENHPDIFRLRSGLAHNWEKRAGAA